MGKNSQVREEWVWEQRNSSTGADGGQSGKYLSAVYWKKFCPARSKLQTQSWGNGGHSRVWRQMCHGTGGWSFVIPAPCFQNPHKSRNIHVTVSSWFSWKLLSPPFKFKLMFVNSANATPKGVLPEILYGFSTLSHPKTWSMCSPWTISYIWSTPTLL